MDKLRRLLKHSGANQSQFWMGVGGKVLVELLPLACFLLVFDFLLNQQLYSLLTMLLIASGVVAGQWLIGQSAKFSFLGAYEITYQLRKRLLLDVRGQPLASLMGKSLGEKMKLVTSDLKSFEEVFSHLVCDFVATCVMPLAMLVVLWTVSPMLSLILAGVLIFAWVVLMIAETRFAAMAQHHHKVHLRNTDQLLEYLDCLPMLKTFGRSDRLARPLEKQIEAMRQSGLGLEWAGGTGVMLATFILELSVPFMAFLAATLVAEGILSVGDWLVVVIASVVTTRPFARLAVYSTMLRYMMKAAFRLHGLATSPQQVKSGTSPTSFDIELNQVSVNLGEVPVIKDVSLIVNQGEQVAIVGPSGAGKSTLLHLMAAFYIPCQGEVKLGGKPLEAIGTLEWYKHVSYVTQEVQLFAGSLKDNLLIANKQADDKALNQVITLAGLEDLVARLPEGLESEVGENGGQLSGGERQRLSLARALLHDTPVILLDEVTSALDVVKQAQVLEALTVLCKGKTVITVAHRLDTVQHLDRIYLMDKGSIVESGQHHELLSHSLGYQKLWQAGQVA